MLSILDEIKNKVDIVDLIGSYIRLKKTGSNYSAICPFHSEKKPSFFVSPRLQIFKCFGCGVGGDIFKFVMLIEGVEFKDALRILAKRANVELKPISAEEKTERQVLWEILEMACRFFEKQLEEGKVGKLAKEYLLKRKITTESIQKWRLGWAPETKNSLVTFLSKKGWSPQQIVKAGLAFKGESGEYIDFFRGRIIFPILDINSQVVGFAGRVFGKKEEPKYINSPGTLLYDKSQILYGLNQAKLEIRAKDNCVIMEGYTDVILAHQEGFKNAVSVAGTSLTQYQLNILKRYTENLTLAFDMDIGGDSATKRGIDLARIKGFNVKVLILPQGKDPADVLSENPEEFAKMLEKSVSIMDYYLQNALSKYDRKTLEGKKQITKILLPEIKRIENEIEKSFWLSKLSEVLEIREDDLRKELAKLSLKEEFFGLEPEEVAKIEEKPKTKREILEERLIFLVLKFPDFISKIQQEILEYLKEETKEILEVLKGNKKKEELSEQAKEIYFSLALKSEIEEISIEEAEKDFGFCQKEIYLLSIKEELNKISQQLKLKKDDKELLEKFKILSQKIAEIQK